MIFSKTVDQLLKELFLAGRRILSYVLKFVSYLKSPECINTHMQTKNYTHVFKLVIRVNLHSNTYPKSKSFNIDRLLSTNFY